LYFGGNTITSLPDSLGQLTGLRVLDLHLNEIKSLSGSLGQLTGLQKVILGDNEIRSRPDSLGQLTNLQECTSETMRSCRCPTAFAGQLTNFPKLHL
jgi:Leucine-rich repeat (LRR) protein